MKWKWKMSPLTSLCFVVEGKLTPKFTLMEQNWKQPSVYATVNPEPGVNHDTHTVCLLLFKEIWQLLEGIDLNLSQFGLRVEPTSSTRRSSSSCKSLKAAALTVWWKISSQKCNGSSAKLVLTHHSWLLDECTSAYGQRPRLFSDALKSFTSKQNLLLNMLIMVKQWSISLYHGPPWSTIWLSLTL